MLLDEFGREIPIKKILFPGAGRCSFPETSDRDDGDVSYNLTPAKVTSIMNAANSGDAEEQAKLAADILEKDDSVIAAFSVRSKALQGLDWHIESDKSALGKQLADKLTSEFINAGTLDECDSLDDLISDMMKAVITGYSLNEVIWLPGGSLGGFAAINADLLDFSNGFTPELRVNCSRVALKSYKYVWNFTREHGSDPVRGGLIRPLAWIYCFSHMSTKDLLAFAERYAMPFLIAKVSDDAFQNELQTYLKLIQSFGPRGGGVVKQGTEIDFAQVPNGSGDVYFRMLERFDGVVQRLILGQTASSGDSGGMSKGDAQSHVRQDILEADAKQIAGVITRDVVNPWVAFNAGKNNLGLKFVFDVTVPEDVEAKYRAKKEHADAIGVAVRGGIVTPTAEDEVAFREVLGLPPMPESAKREWARSKGVRAPITLVNAQTRPNEATALTALSKAPDLSAPAKSGDEWFSPVADELTELLESDIPEAEFSERLKKLCSGEKFGSSEKFEKTLSSTVYDGYCAGALEADRRIKNGVRGGK